MKNNHAARAVPDSRDPAPGRILRGLEFLQQCHADRQAFAVVTGEHADNLSTLLATFVERCDRDRAAHVVHPTADAGEFLQAVLGQFGFETFDASVEDLANLVTVYVRHEAADSGPIVIALEQAEAFGPRVFEMVRRLSTLGTAEQPALMFALAGSDALDQILKSRALAGTPAAAAPRFRLDEPVAPAPDVRVAAVDVERVPSGGEITVTLDGNRIGRYSLDRGQLLIGRTEQNDVQIVSRFVSRHHALLLSRPEGAYITDLKSTNGTYVNSLPISQHALRDGDIIMIGNFRLLYRDARVRCGSEWPADHSRRSSHQAGVPARRPRTTH